MQSIPNEDQEPINLKMYWLVLRRRWFALAGVAIMVFGLVALKTFLQKPVYKAEGQMMLTKKDPVSSLTDLTDKVGEITGVTQTSNPVDTEALVIQSIPLVQKTIDTLNLKNSRGERLEPDEFLKNQLKVKGIRGTDMLKISYQGTKPQEVAAVVNLLMQYYLENNIRVNRAEATAAREFISKQLPEVEARVKAAEVALRQFKDANRVVALEEEAKFAIKGLSELSAQITQAKADLADATSQSSALQREIGLTPSEAIALTTLNQSPAVQQVLTEYQQVQDQLAVKLTRYAPENPEIVSLTLKEKALKNQLELRISQALGGTQSVSSQDLQLSKLKQGLTENLVKAEATRLGLANRVSVLNDAMRNYQTRASVLPQLEQNQRELERRVEVARVTYEQLLKRLQEVEVTENQNVGNARVVSSAIVPQRPVSPRKSLNLAIGGLMGILFGTLTALVLDATDKSVKTSEEAQKLAGYPLLGLIPLVSPKGKGRNRALIHLLPMRDNPYSSICRNFEMLQTTLGFTVSDQPLKIILVTSAVSGEGKSFIAANLALATAQMGRRVLLLDADMRDPNQHLIWQQMNLKGLSDILVDQATFSEIATATHPNLSVLTSGTTPPNPVALLDSQRMASLIKSVIGTYDFIILDTPALTLAPDALTLGKLVDGVLFVVRPGVVDSAAVKQAKTLLTQAGQRVLGMVVNSSLPDRGSNAFHHTNGGSKKPLISSMSLSSRSDHSISQMVNDREL